MMANIEGPLRNKLLHLARVLVTRREIVKENNGKDNQEERKENKHLMTNYYITDTEYFTSIISLNLHDSLWTAIIPHMLQQGNDLLRVT